MSEYEGYETLSRTHDKCRECGADVSRRGLSRGWHRHKAHGGEKPEYEGKVAGVGAESPGKVEALPAMEPPISEEPLDDLLELTGEKDMTKEEAMRYAARLIRDEAVPANQKGPLLSAMARVAGWETAPEYDFEKERGKWMANFEKMVKSHVGLEAGLRELLAKYPSSAVELKGVLGG